MICREIYAKTIFSRNKGNLTYSYNQILRIFSIDSIFVKPEFRRAGVGTKLIKKALARARKIHRIDDDVRVILRVDKAFKDFKLIKWFRKFGFKKGDKFKTLRTMFVRL